MILSNTKGEYKENIAVSFVQNLLFSINRKVIYTHKHQGFVMSKLDVMKQID